MVKPLSEVWLSVTWPTGSGRLATKRRASAMPLRRVSSSARRSSMASPTPLSRAAAMSSALAASTVSRPASRASAMACSKSFFSCVPSSATATAACLHARARSRTESVIGLGSFGGGVMAAADRGEVVAMHDRVAVAVAEAVLDFAGVATMDDVDFGGAILGDAAGDAQRVVDIDDFHHVATLEFAFGPDHAGRQQRCALFAQGAGGAGIDPDAA